jgi:hypothetical protein
MKTVLNLAVVALAAAASPAFAKGLVVNQAITEPEVLAAQQGWCKALVDIAATGAKSGQPAAKALAEKVIDSAYGYQMGAVLFKPTLTTNPQTFRTTRAGALAYFVGGDPAFPKDTGFALKGWTKCDVHHHGQGALHRQGRQGHLGGQDLEIRQGRCRQAAHRGASLFAGVQRQVMVRVSGLGRCVQSERARHATHVEPSLWIRTYRTSTRRQHP